MLPFQVPRGVVSACCVRLQRGDAEMSNKLWRVVRACVELGPKNPIQQIHDQGAGGNCNVVKEIIYPLGAEIDIRCHTPLQATIATPSYIHSSNTPHPE